MLSPLLVERLRGDPETPKRQGTRRERNLSSWQSGQTRPTNSSSGLPSHPPGHPPTRECSAAVDVANDAARLRLEKYSDLKYVGQIVSPPADSLADRACLPGSVYGQAEAGSPLLKKKLKGPVYLVPSGHELPDLVADLRTDRPPTARGDQLPPRRPEDGLQPAPGRSP